MGNIGTLLSRLEAEGLIAPAQRLEIESNEWGVKSMERRYSMRNLDYPNREPAFGQAPTSPADMDLSFLGKHSARFTRGPAGIGQLQVLYKGATFNAPAPSDEDTTDPLLSTSSQQREQTSLVV